MRRLLKPFAILTTVGMIFVLLGGALVTKTDSGLGCGRSWPLCHGKFIPDGFTVELIFELAHRLVSGVIGIMVVILAVWAWKAVGHLRETKFLSILSVVFIIAQSLLGAAAVVFDQSDAVLAAHFGISLISFATVFLLTMLILESEKRFNIEKLYLHGHMRKHIFAVTIYSFIVVYTGAFVQHVGASLACKDWPFCVNNVFGWPGNIQEWVQMGHRFAAGLLFLWIGYITILALKNYKSEKFVYRWWMAAFLLITLQIITGALVVLSRINLIISLTHAFFIICLFGILSYFVLLSLRSRRKENSLQEANKKPASSTISTLTTLQ